MGDKHKNLPFADKFDGFKEKHVKKLVKGV